MRSDNIIHGVCQMKFVSLYALKEMGRQKKFVIPCMFTLLNACFGFFSLIKTLECDFLGAAYFIIGAVFMDMLDGRVARALRSTSAIGMELDSLADAVSFCVAPAILLYSLYCVDMHIVGVMALSFYMCAGLSRLARFNVSGPKPFFIGLPTPIAAFFIVQVVLHEAWLSQIGCMPTFPVVVSIVTLLGVLMVSPVLYPSFKKITPYMIYRLLSLISIAVGLSWWYQAPFFLITTFLYILLGSRFCF